MMRSPWPRISRPATDTCKKFAIWTPDKDLAQCVRDTRVAASAADLRDRLDNLTDVEIDVAARRMTALRPLYDWSRISSRHLRFCEALTAPESAGGESS